ncbi:hypothetical protein HWV62_45531 [Athelia sp. TMB]|nr:hypothetical protein HWV62_45531 [Athelia sp. TMB]
MTRLPTTTLPLPEAQSFLLSATEKSYAHQYANIYYQRLISLKPVIQERALARWGDVQGNPELVERVLEVVKGQLCWVIGTVYMDMRLKPNVLEDIARDRSIPAPPPPANYVSLDDAIMLEDESGRIHLTGDRLAAARLVTGVIVGVLGMEAPDGDFQVIDLCTAGLPPPLPLEKPEPGDAMDVDAGSDAPDEWLALVSGLDIGAPSPADAQLQLLIEYLTGAAPAGPVPPAHITRLLIAGNSLAPPADAPPTTSSAPATEATLKARRYGDARAGTAFSPHPAHTLSAALLDLARALPVHVLPGAADPAGAILPQAPFPRALFGAAARAGVACETNPAWVRLAAPAPSSTPARTVLAHAGQPLDDLCKYLPDAPRPTAARLALAASTLQWRHMAPTAPDTLWCHPFLDRDPFLLGARPDVYVAGCQPAFGTRFIRADGEKGEGKKGGGEGAEGTRIILLPSFARTGLLVLLNLRTLRVRRVRFGVRGMGAGGGEGDGVLDAGVKEEDMAE